MVAFDKLKAVGLASHLLARGTEDPRIESVTIDYKDHGTFEVEINDGYLTEKQIRKIVDAANLFSTHFQYVDGKWIAGRED